MRVKPAASLRDVDTSSVIAIIRGLTHGRRWGTAMGAYHALRHDLAEPDLVLAYIRDQFTCWIRDQLNALPQDRSGVKVLGCIPGTKDGFRYHCIRQDQGVHRDRVGCYYRDFHPVERELLWHAVETLTRERGCAS